MKLKGLKEAYILVDLLPEMTIDEAQNQINMRLSSSSERTVAEKISGLIPTNIADVISKRKGDLIDNLKNMRIDITGSMEFDRAQITIGGVKLSSLNNGLSLKNRDDVYVIGEAVNVDGPCGGYNLQWAWSSAAVAANDIAGRIS